MHHLGRGGASRFRSGWHVGKRVSGVFMNRDEVVKGKTENRWAFSKVGASESSPSGRVLQAVELLGQNGPMTYKELGLALDMTRAATWRLVATLREAHWVCIRHGGSVIQLDPRLDELFATATFADAEFTDVANVMSEVAASLPVHVDLFSPDRMGELVLHETSRRLTVSAPLSDLPDELLLLAMHAAMTPPQLERHVAHAKAKESDILRHLVGASARRKIQQFPGQAWSADQRFLIISVRGTMGTAAAMRIAPKVSSVKPPLLVTAFNALREKLTGKLDMFGNGTALVDAA